MYLHATSSWQCAIAPQKRRPRSEIESDDLFEERRDMYASLGVRPYILTIASAEVSNRSYHLLNTVDESIAIEY